jgi:hypothetical protein
MQDPGSQLREEQAREQQMLIQALKEDIIDAVNDLKGNAQIWSLGPS